MTLVWKELQKRFYTTNKHYYQMPDKYRNSFYLANASLCDTVNWYIHNAYELVFTDLVEDYKENQVKKHHQINDHSAREQIEYKINMLEPCNSLVDINFRVKRENGHIDILRGFRAHHGLHNLKSPYLGGFTMSTNLSRDQVKAMALLATYKHALFNIEMSGAHGGIKLCPQSLGSTDLRKTIETYVNDLSKTGYSGHSVDIMEPGLSVKYEDMSCLANTFSKIQDCNFVSVGKCCNSGGFPLYDSASGKSVVYILRELLEDDGIAVHLNVKTGLKHKNFIIDGLGKLGRSIGLSLQDSGAKCVGIKEHDSTIYDPVGISISEIWDHKVSHGTLIGFNDQVKPNSNSIVLTEPCDILVLAATHKSLQCYLADKVIAKVIVEAANASVTPSAHKILTSHGKLVLPDLLMGAGSTLLSYYEYLKCSEPAAFDIITKKFKKKNEIRTEDETDAFAALDNKLDTALTNVLVTRNKYNLGLDFKTAAYATAIKNTFKNIFVEKDSMKTKRQYMQ